MSVSLIILEALFTDLKMRDKLIFEYTKREKGIMEHTETLRKTFIAFLQALGYFPPFPLKL